MRRLLKPLLPSPNSLELLADYERLMAEYERLMALRPRLAELDQLKGEAEKRWKEIGNVVAQNIGPTGALAVTSMMMEADALLEQFREAVETLLQEIDREHSSR